MPSQKLEFGKGSWPALDEATTDGALPASFIDGYQDEQGVYFKRPGLTALTDSALTGSVQGIFWSIGLQKFIACAEGALYSIDPTTWIVTPITGDALAGGKVARFTEDGTIVYVADGDKMVTTDGSTSVEVADAVAPIVVTHVAWLDDHILANESGTGRFWWTDAGTTTWGGANYANANANIDYVVAMAVLARELYLFGTHSTEIWYNAGEALATFQRHQGAFFERGCSAPYSVIKAMDTLFWLDHERNFVRLDGRNPKVVSGPVTRILRELPTVADMVCSHFQYLNQRFILLSSVAESFSLVYDPVQEAWYQWGKWNSALMDYDEWPVQSVAFSPEFSVYVALGMDGLLYKISGDATDARFLLRSAHLSFGTYKWKVFAEMLVRAKRGYVTDASEPKFWVRWRDQNDRWSNEHYISLHKSGQYRNVEHMHRLGRARTRQFEFGQTDVAPFAFVGAEIILDVKED